MVVMVDYKSTTEQGECIFCKIINGDIKIPGIFWENKDFLAFLSTWPNTQGFTVVVPKEHHGSNVLGMPNDVLSKFVHAAKTVSKILVKHFDDVGRVGLIMEGTGIDHAHIKLFPMHGTGHMKKGEWKQYHSDSDKYFETYEGYIASNDGPKADEQKIRDLAELLRETK